MAIPEEFRNCVAFLCVEEINEHGKPMKIPKATGFYVAHPISHGVSVLYLVTARHVVEKSRSYGQLYLRYNKVNGIDYMPIDQDLFVLHPSTDVAVLYLPNMPAADNIAVVPFSAFMTKEQIINEKITEGDDVFIAGLFTEYTGSERNQPIIRFGKVALSFREKIRLQLSPETQPMAVDAFLVESLSWGGESGSPVFVNLTTKRHESVIDPSREFGYRVLGLVHGHYQIEQQVKDKHDVLGTVDLNAGIMAIIPAQAIIDTLQQEEIVKQREQLKKREPNGPTP